MNFPRVGEIRERAGELGIALARGGASARRGGVPGRPTVHSRRVIFL